MILVCTVRETRQRVNERTIAGRTCWPLLRASASEAWLDSRPRGVYRCCRPLSLRGQLCPTLCAVLLTQRLAELGFAVLYFSFAFLTSLRLICLTYVKTFHFTSKKLVSEVLFLK